MRFANCRRFIRNFSSMTAHLTSKRTSAQLKWSPMATQAFQDLKTRFTSAPILHHPNPDIPFIVEVDASNTGIGLPPKLFPCAFFSRILSSTERNYDVGNREFLAMKAALEKWRHWLEGANHPFVILMDHKNLEYLRSAKRLIRHLYPRTAPQCHTPSPLSPQLWSSWHHCHDTSTQ